jgi:hypothetical protein
MSLTQQKINLLKKIVDNRLSKVEMQQVIAKAEEIIERREEPERKVETC